MHSTSSPEAGLLRVEGGSAALPFVRMFYGASSEYLWEDSCGTVHRIPQGEGGEQGDALMPLLFALGQHSALEEASQNPWWKDESLEWCGGGGEGEGVRHSKSSTRNHGVGNTAWSRRFYCATPPERDNGVCWNEFPWCKTYNQRGCCSSTVLLHAPITSSVPCTLALWSGMLDLTMRTFGNALGASFTLTLACAVTRSVDRHIAPHSWRDWPPKR